MLVPAFLLTLLIALFPAHARAEEHHCPPGSRARLAQSIAKIQKFIVRSRHSSSFNFDRLDYLLKIFEAREELWAACENTKGSLHEKRLRHRLRALHEKLAQERALPPGKAPISSSTISEIDRLFSEIPLGPPRFSEQKRTGKKNHAAGMVTIVSRSLLIGTIVMAGVMALLVALRLSHRQSSTFNPCNRWEGLQKLGEKWSRLPEFRSQFMTALKRRLAREKNRLRVCVQLFGKGKEGGDWKIVDEIVEDEEGLLRSFGTPSLGEDVVEKVTEVPLGEGELRTRVVCPLPEREGEKRVLVLDALSSPEIEFLLPDPSGLKTLSQMKELLFEAAGAGSSEKKPLSIGVISLFFHDPEKSQVLIGRDEDAFSAKKFIVEELGRIIPSSIAIYGEDPGYFHVVVIGLSELETGTLIRKMAEGLGPAPKKGARLQDKPWFQKMMVAYTRWREPDPEKIDHLIAQIHGNLEKIRNNPSIRTVIDA